MRWSLFAAILTHGTTILAITNTYLLEDFDSYTSSVYGMSEGFPAYTSTITNSYPSTVQWNVSNKLRGDSDLIVSPGAGANGTRGYLSLTETHSSHPALYNLDVRFTPVSEQFAFYELYMFSPTGGNHNLRLSGSLVALIIGFNSGSGNAEGQTFTYSENTWNQIRVFANQNDSSCTNQGSFKLFINHVQIGSDICFRSNWVGEQVRGIKLFANEEKVYLDSVRFYGSATAPAYNDFIAPTKTLSNSTITDTQNPNLGLSFSDSGVGAELSHVFYRFNSATAMPTNFTSDGVTDIGTDIVGSTYSPTNIKISDTDWAKIAFGSSATIYITAQDEGANISSQIALTITNDVEKSESPSTQPIIAPSLFRPSQHQSLKVINVGQDAEVGIYNLTKRLISQKRGSNTVEFSLSDLNGALSSGIYFVKISSSTGQKMIKFAVVR